MNLLVITCYTGDAAHAKMTLAMLEGVHHAAAVAQVSTRFSVVAQGTDHKLGREWMTHRLPKNQGFAKGMNKALGHGLIDSTPDAVLCINNDIEFPREDWLANLISESQPDHVGVPTTNYTGERKQERKGYSDDPAFDLPSTPAVCWLLPWAACEVLFRFSGGPGKLFREDLGKAGGEDAFATAVLNKHWKSPPFRVVPRAFVFHHGARTSRMIPASQRMASSKKARKLIKEKL